MSAFPLKLEGHEAVVIKEEPEDILPISADESVHSDDYGKMSAFPLKLEGHEAVVIKEEPEDAPPTPTDQSVQSDNSGNMSMYPLQLEGHGDNAVSVKIEADEASATSTCGDLDGKDACRLSVSLEPVDVVHVATVVIKQWFSTIDVSRTPCGSAEIVEDPVRDEGREKTGEAHAAVAERAAAAALARQLCAV
ncbi:hypothetical protein HPB47_003346 [Ixodes persulcatus]|uniref:Uncharacterized protein n=1 Tax=Ixodes persulcatus TaxID=34615 RepID=A0AC60PK79_IXOPE|nr:hypothetical protein HPB47_003346 [Ixodes persulcatus]